MMKLHELVLENWRRHRLNKAVLFDDGSRKSHITYQNMIDMSDKMMSCFTDQSHQSEVIGLCLQPDQYLPAILLSVLRCGATFYNMDADSVDFAFKVLNELGVRILVLHRNSSKEIIRTLGSDKAYTEFVIPGLDTYVMYKLNSTPVRTHRHDLAYCITTSGTTGVPKIVRVPHACVVPNITHLKEIFNITPDDIVLLSSPLTFDPSLVEMFTTLRSGACLLVVPDRVKMTPDLLMKVIHERNQVTVMQITPTLLHRFPVSVLSDTILGKHSKLRVLALGGERFPPLSTMKMLKHPDNKTRLFNLYGTTEVSSWATCCEVKSKDLELGKDVPLGSCLRDTVVEVRSSEGLVMAEGVGELYIGGSCRQCILSPEENNSYNPSHVKMRSTGDIVEIWSDGQIYYLGRTDRQVKRHGKRINLEEIQSVASTLCNIHSCETIMVSSKLILFAVLANDSKSTIATILQTADLHETDRDDSSKVSVVADDKEEIKSHLAKRLPGHSIPDDVIVVENLPMTKHGKVDLKQLESVFTDRCRLRQPLTSPVEVLTFKWKELLHIKSPISEDVNFISMGGNSLKALHLLNEIEQVLDRNLPELLDIILQKTFKDVRDFCYCKQIDPIGATFATNNINQVSTSARNDVEVDNHKMYTEMDKTIHEYTDTNYRNEEILKDASIEGKNFDLERRHDSFKRKLQNDVLVINKQKIPKYKSVAKFCLSVSRGSRVVNVINNTDDNAVDVHDDSGQDEVEIEHTSTVNNDIENRDDDINCVKVEISDNHFVTGTTGLQLKECWRYNNGKCVDASPLLAISSEPGRDMVFVYWLPLSQSVCPATFYSRADMGGCYDGKVYCLEADTGDIWWSHDTGSEVKSSPAVDRVTGLVYIGSHSQRLYCLDVQNCSVRWETHLEAGSIFSSPAVWYDPHCVYVGTLGGKVLALDAVSGAVLWRTDLGRPVFASVAVCHPGLCVGCTDNTLYFLNHAGQKMWSYRTDGPIFSSPVMFSLPTPPVCRFVSTMDTNKDNSISRELIVFGCHDNHIYCVSSLKGELLWKCTTNSSVYSTPFVTTVTVKQTGVEAKDCHSNDIDHVSEKSVFDASTSSMNNDETIDVGTADRWLSTKLSPIPEGVGHSFALSHQDHGQMTAKFSKDSVLDKSTSPENANSHSDTIIEEENADLALDQKLPIVVFSSSKGTLYVVHANTGSVLATRELPHEVFSSAVVYDNTVTVGCRDNFVYTFKLT